MKERNQHAGQKGDASSVAWRAGVDFFSGSQAESGKRSA